MEMDNKDRIARLSEKKYKEVLGVTKAVFEQMLAVLGKSCERERGIGGRPQKLSVLDKLIILLDYYKSYRPMERIAFDYGVSKGLISTSIAWVEQVLIQEKDFHLPSKKELRESDFEIILVDCTESPIERPKKGQKAYYSGKKNDTQ